MTRKQRLWVWLAMACGGVTMYQGLGFTTGYLTNYGGAIGGSSGTGCSRFATNGLASSVDFCYLLDCDSGFFGGIVDPCAGGTTGDLLTDCAGQITTTDQTNTTTNNQTTTTNTGRTAT